MKIELEPTGERVIEQAYRRSLGAYVIYAMHAASYAWVEPLCRGARVLDLGCGSGYGSHRIAACAAAVTGVDVADDAVAFARSRYTAPNLRYERIEAGGRLPFDDASFDVVLSFQVIEHVADVRGYLAEARRVLRPGGAMVVITPDRRHRLLPGQKPWNRWHLHEYSGDGLAAAVGEVLAVESVLRMGAPDAIAGVELRRYRRTKWLTLPATLPFLPERARRFALDLIHAVRGNGAKVDAADDDGPEVDYGFDESAFEISADAPNSLNLVLVARRPEADAG